MNNTEREKSSDVRFYRCGDRALTVEFGDRIDEVINSRVLAFDRSLERSRVTGILETVPTYRSLLVCYEPSQISYEALCRILEKRLGGQSSTEETEFRIWEIPCCYGLYFGRDLEIVSKHTGLHSKEIIERHSSVEYRVYMLGFLPGFVYLGGLDEKLFTPRLSVPRVMIPRGSVGIGGSQTGIYPLPSPGGWNLIGCTPIELYDVKREEPALCRAGDRIRFFPISNADYYDIRREVLRGKNPIRMRAVRGVV